MLFLLALHIIALLFWVAVLLYLPTLLASQQPLAEATVGDSDDGMSRWVFTRVAGPASLLAILSGTLVFLVDQNTEAWLVLKLTLVAGMVLCHALIGMMIVRAEKGRQTRIRLFSGLVSAVLVVLMLLVFYLVLAKPAVEVPLSLGL